MTQLYSPIETIELEIVRKGELLNHLQAQALNAMTYNAPPEVLMMLESIATNFGLALQPSVLMLPEKAEVE